jgi:hypothetical protein
LNRDLVLLVAIVLAVIGPTLNGLGNPSNVAALILLIALATSRSYRDQIGLAHLLLLVALLASLSTIAGLLAVGGSYEINHNAFGPFVRMAICFYALRSARDPVALLRRLLWLGAGASVFAVLQFFMPAVAAFTSTHYLAGERSAVFTEDFSGDSIVRVIGFYENPSSVALLSIALILLSVHAYKMRHLAGGVLVLFVVVHLAAGVLSLSKVFFAGLPLMFAQLIALRYHKSAALSVAVLMASVSVLLAIDDPLVGVVRYAIDATLDPDVALQGRYLDEQAAAVARSWFLGHGLVGIGYVTINDSAYLIVGYLFGVFGACVLAGFVLWGLLRNARQLPASLHFVLLAILIAGVGANSILGFRLDIFLTALCAVLCPVSTPELKDAHSC